MSTTKQLGLSAVETTALQKRIRDDSPVDANGCWIWQLSTKNGYGQISVRNSSTYTHQLSHVVFIGPIPDGMQVCHTCDVRRCNNPEHFFLGTMADNMRDMRAKGRGTNPPVVRGERHPKATLSDSDVGAIRELVQQGTRQREIAAQFGCSQSTVWRYAHKLTRAERES